VALVLVLVTGGADVMNVSGAVSSPTTMVQEWDAGSSSTLPAASIARTRSVWSPTASSVNVTREGQGENGAPSSEHSYVVPSSLAEKRNVALVLVVRAGGASVIVVSGGVVSPGPWTVQLCRAGDGSTWPSPSIDRTAKLCQPTARSVYSTGEVHASYAAPSSAHSKVAGEASEENKMDADVSVVVSAGPKTIVVSGGATTVQV
jgi:hypothetical protein